ncbi:hypothetical protein BDM02DRAFT_3115685 [Thelephora ganbajun]|uniref:Uncharacterized protein n=1 Tax=Thelephora ganbajun TaxID=370292 RepID=A0ACB6ZF09_THEGA|nr:hypothetical protein BDM02DRAFT_3115685 [Thelephora ganbajun]
MEASSDQIVQAIYTTLRGYIALLPNYDTKTRYCIEVYKPTEAFEEAYGKTVVDLESLKLEEQHLRANPVKCVMLSPQGALSDADAGQTLIVVFGIPPRPSTTLTLSDMFLRLKIVDEAPSRVSQPESYKALQSQSEQRNLDDRPSADRFIPPISLLYDGFGVFEDVRRGIKVLGEDDILEGQLWGKVNAFVDRMAEFYDSEAERRADVVHHLEEMFHARKDPSKIGACHITSDGHLNGAHEAMVFCVECKNELSNISCEPSAELVSYVASSFKEQLRGKHRALFHAWRVPALGMTQIGPFVQFFGIVMLAPQMRVVHLTPMLPLAIPTDDEQSLRNIFLAFKAASIVVAKIQADVRRLLQETTLPEIPLESRELPSVTDIEAPHTSASPSRIKFTLVGRYDQEVVYRNLYHARLDPTNEEIYVKFTRQYSRELHVFCAKRGLAPELLGFERLTGGWFALAMKKVDIVEPWKIQSFPELETWKKEIRQLVKDFHQEGLVHGDLRLANFIFTEGESPRRMLLIDFDWGGKAGEVFFPPGQLVEDLKVQDDRLDRPITKEHDDRVLAGAFTRLDQLVAFKTR